MHSDAASLLVSTSGSGFVMVIVIKKFTLVNTLEIIKESRSASDSSELPSTRSQGLVLSPGGLRVNFARVFQACALALRFRPAHSPDRGSTRFFTVLCQCGRPARGKAASEASLKLFLTGLYS